jgi:hypothetical protein
MPVAGLVRSPTITLAQGDALAVENGIVVDGLLSNSRRRMPTAL